MFGGALWGVYNVKETFLVYVFLNKVVDKLRDTVELYNLSYRKTKTIRLVWRGNRLTRQKRTAAAPPTSDHVTRITFQSCSNLIGEQKIWSRLFTCRLRGTLLNSRRRRSWWKPLHQHRVQSDPVSFIGQQWRRNPLTVHHTVFTSRAPAWPLTLPPRGTAAHMGTAGCQGDGGWATIGDDSSFITAEESVPRSRTHSPPCTVSGCALIKSQENTVHTFTPLSFSQRCGLKTHVWSSGSFWNENCKNGFHLSEMIFIESPDAEIQT